jgi:GT2 family glycosyltransferase
MQKIQTLENSTKGADSEQSFISILMQEIELDQPLPTLSAFDKRREQTYQRTRCLIRLHTRPIGLVDFTFDTDKLFPNEYASCIWQALKEQINAHLRDDGLPEVATLDAIGLPSLRMPPCLEELVGFIQMAPFASVILATRDRSESLARCLPTLLAQHYPAYEVIVVDNAPSTSATADLIQHTFADEPRIRYVCEDHPGLPFAHNRGLLEAKGKIIAFTDDDVVVDSYWLAGLIKGFEAAENVACVTGLILPMELETPAQFLFEAYGGFTMGFSRRIFDLREHRGNNPSYPYISGACTAGVGASMAFTAKFLKSEGGFDHALGPGCLTCGGEDLDVFFRVIKHGYRLVYEPTSLLYHQHRRDYWALKKQMYEYGLGFTAYLTKLIIESPWLIPECIYKFVRSLLFLLRTRSLRSQERTFPFPQELKHLEWKGKLNGPFAYLQSRRAYMNKEGKGSHWARTVVSRKKMYGSANQYQVSLTKRMKM